MYDDNLKGKFQTKNSINSSTKIIYKSKYFYK